jgi:hypothetical protein
MTVVPAAIGKKMIVAAVFSFCAEAQVSSFSFFFFVFFSILPPLYFLFPHLLCFSFLPLFSHVFPCFSLLFCFSFSFYLFFFCFSLFLSLFLPFLSFSPPLCFLYFFSLFLCEDLKIGNNKEKGEKRVLS